MIGESFPIVVTRRLQEGEAPLPDDTLPNVTGDTRFEQILGDSLRLISRTDESANFEFVKEDVLGLATSIDIGSVTTFLAGYSADRPDTFIMRKPVPNGCLYAFKAGDYCVAGATSAAELTFSRNGVSMTANACNLQNPDNVPVVEVPPRASAER